MAIFFAGIEAHLHWGNEYTGPGMHQVSLLAAVVTVSMACSGMFLLCSAIYEWGVGGSATRYHWVRDVLLFFLWGGIAVWVAVTAKIVD